MFSSNDNQQGVAEPIRLSISAYRSRGRENRRAGAGATTLHNPNARQRASDATAVVVGEIAILRQQLFRGRNLAHLRHVVVCLILVGPSSKK
jgi:hypothetical protein